VQSKIVTIASGKGKIDLLALRPLMPMPLNLLTFPVIPECHEEESPSPTAAPKNVDTITATVLYRVGRQLRNVALPPCPATG